MDGTPVHYSIFCRWCPTARSNSRRHSAKRLIRSRSFSSTDKLLGQDRVRFYAADVCDFATLNDSVARAVTEVGSPGLAFHAAGTHKAGIFVEQSLDDFSRVIEVNFMGTVHFARAVIPHMEAGSQLALVALMAGLVGNFAYSAYCTSKHAVVGLAACLRQELLMREVAVSVVCPPEVETPLVDEERKTMRPITRELKSFAKTLNPVSAVSEIVDQLEKRRFKVIPGSRARIIERLARFMPGLLDVQVDRTIRKVGATL